ncbi:MAG: HIT family protein [Anaerolineae bacterium]
MTVTDRALCFVCRKHQGEEPVPGGPIYEDDLVYASHQAVPAEGCAYLGYCFVDLRRHAPGLADLTDAEAQAVGRLVAHLSRALKAELHAENVYAFVVGDRVPHLHIHLIPRHPGAPQEYCGVRVDEWPDAPRGDEAEVTALVNRLRLRLQREAPDSADSVFEE